MNHRSLPTATRRRAALAVAPLIALAPLSPLWHLGWTAEAAACAAQHTSGHWTRSAFPLPTTQYDAMVRDPKVATRMFATDGSSVVRSVDGGCSWTSAWGHSGPDTSAVPGGTAALPTSYGYYVSQIVPSGGSTVYATLAPEAHAQIAGTFGPSAPPVFLLASQDGGATFNVVTPDAVNQPRCNTSSLAVAASNPHLLYLECEGAVFADSFIPLPVVGQPTSPEPLSDSAEVIYVSTNGGTGWQRQLQQGIPQPSVGVFNLAVDPFNQNELWGRVALNAATQRVAVVHSLDGGKHWTLSYMSLPASGTPDMLGLAFVHTAKKQPARLLAWGPSGVVLSLNSGRSWQQLGGAAAGIYAAGFDATGASIAVAFSPGDTSNYPASAPCKSSAKLFVYNPARLRKAPVVSPVALSPAATNFDLTSLGSTGGSANAFTGLVRTYAASGSAPNASACTLPQTPTPPPPAPPVARPSGASWTESIVTYRG